MINFHLRHLFVYAPYLTQKRRYVLPLPPRLFLRVSLQEVVFQKIYCTHSVDITLTELK